VSVTFTVWLLVIGRNVICVEAEFFISLKTVGEKKNYGEAIFGIKFLAFSAFT